MAGLIHPKDHVWHHNASCLAVSRIRNERKWRRRLRIALDVVAIAVAFTLPFLVLWRVAR